MYIKRHNLEQLPCTFILTFYLFFVLFSLFPFSSFALFNLLIDPVWYYASQQIMGLTRMYLTVCVYLKRPMRNVRHFADDKFNIYSWKKLFYFSLLISLISICQSIRTVGLASNRWQSIDRNNNKPFHWHSPVSPSFNEFIIVKGN